MSKSKKRARANSQYILALNPYMAYDHEKTWLLTATPARAIDIALNTLCNEWMFFGSPVVFLGAYEDDGRPNELLSHTIKFEVLEQYQRDLRVAKFNRPATVAEVEPHWWPDHITLDGDAIIPLSDMLKFEQTEFSLHFIWLLRHKGLIK